MATMKRILSAFIVLFVLATASLAATEALQIDALWSGLNNPTNGKSYSGAIVATFAADGSTAKAIWEDKEKTLPSALGKAQFTLDSNGQAEVFGDGVYVIKVYAPSDTGLTNPLMTFDGLTYINPEGALVSGIDSVTDLRGGTGGESDGETATLLGYYTEGDGGGQGLFWNATSTETDNNISIFKVTSITTGRWESVDSEFLTVLHAGAKGDGSTDDYQAIIDTIAVFNNVIFPGNRTYRIETKLTITAANIFLVGEPGFRPIIKNGIPGSTSDCIEFTTITPDDSSLFTSGGGIENITINSIADQTDGSALVVTKRSGFKSNNFTTLNHPDGIEISGIRSGKFDNFSLFGPTTGSRVVGSSLIAVRGQLNSDTSYSSTWTTDFTNFTLGGGFNSDYGIYISECDGLNFTTGYVASAFNSLVQVQVENTGTVAVAIEFANIYFDGVNRTTGTLHGATFFEDDGAADGVGFTNCLFGNFQQRGFRVLEEGTGSVKLSNVDIRNCGEQGIAIDSVSTKFTMLGGNVRNCVLDSGTAYATVTSSNNTIFSGTNFFASPSGVAIIGILYTGTHNQGSVIGCSFENLTTGDISSSGATFNDMFKQVGNTSDVAGGVVEIIGEKRIEINASYIISGTGTPEGNQTAPVGSVFLRSDGGAGTSFYVKETGTGDTGWVGK